MLEQMPEYLCWTMQSGLDFLTQVREFDNDSLNSLLLEYGINTMVYVLWSSGW